MTFSTASRIILLIITALIVITFCFYYAVLRTNLKDVSIKEPFKIYINTPIVVQSTSELVWIKGGVSHLANEYILQAHQQTLVDEENRKTVKIYQPGDTIYFHKALEFYNASVGTSRFLIGKETLPSGEEVEIEYSTALGKEDKLTSESYGIEIWESLTNYTNRKDKYYEAEYGTLPEPYRINYAAMGTLLQVISQGELRAQETTVTINPIEKTINIAQENIVIYHSKNYLNIKEEIESQEIFFKLKNIKLLSKELYEENENLHANIKLSYTSLRDLEAFEFSLDEHNNLRTNLENIVGHNAISISDNKYWYSFKKDAPIRFSIKIKSYGDAVQFNALPMWKEIIGQDISVVK